MVEGRWYFEVYEDRRGEWRWRLRAGNRKIVADSAEGYDSESNVRRAVVMIQGVGASLVNADVRELPRVRTGPPTTPMPETQIVGLALGFIMKGGRRT